MGATVTRIREDSPLGEAIREAPRGGVARRALKALGSWAGARRSSRALKNWITPYHSTDVSTVPDLHSLRAGSQELYRNAPLARGAISTVATHTVGTGLRPESSINREVLGLTQEQAQDWQDSAEMVWSVHADKLDITQRLTDAELDELILKSQLIDGDVLMVRRFKEVPGQALATRVQLVSGARVSTPNQAFAEGLNLFRAARVDPNIIAGVESDEDGMPMRYWVSNRHPGDVWGAPLTWSSVDAFAEDEPIAGEALSLLVFEPTEGPGQTRGVPYLSPVIETLKQLTEYSEAELSAAVLAAFFTVFTHTEDSGGLASESASTEGDTTEEDEVALGRGAVVGLGLNEKIEIADPSRPNAQFDPYFIAMARQIGVGLELPFEVLIKHFTASYSASRGALLEAWRFIRKRRSHLTKRVKATQWRWVVTEAVARGILPAPGFFDSPMVREAYLRAEWHGDPAGQIDPVKEANALKTYKDMGLFSKKSMTLQTTGGDWRRDAEQRKREQDYEDEIGLRPAAAPPGTSINIDEPGGQRDDDDQT